MIEVDMHTHSCFSDGSDEPELIAKKAKQAGIRAICLTDHDAFQGLPEFLAAAGKYGLDTMSGIEINSFYRGLDVHILGYGFDYSGTELPEHLQRNWDFFEKSARRSIKKFANDGLSGITLEKARVLTDSRGPNFSISHHFSELLAAKKSIGFWEARELTRFTSMEEMGETDLLFKPEEAVALIRSLGGVAILAHPGELVKRSRLPSKKAVVILLELINRLKAVGLFGLEAHHTKHTRLETIHLLKLASRLELEVTAGSDYHGRFKPQVRLGKRGMSYEDFRRIKKFCA